MAWFALIAHRLRTGLTLLGVIIGIVSVVMMVALGESAQRRIQQELKNVPANYFEIYPGKFFGDPDAANLRTLIAADADTLRQQSFVLSVSPTLGSSTSMRLGSLNSNVTVNGVHESFFETSGYELDVGRGFSREDILSQKQVCFLPGTNDSMFVLTKNPT